jgi:hypothetical protein
MQCASCGHENRATASFCGGCAAPLPRDVACAGCGTINPHDLRFCDGCGRPLERGAPTSGTDGPESRSRGSVGQPAAVAGGRYRIRRLIGEGSRKRVYLAYDTRLDREVAVALIKVDGLDEAGLARVRREVRAMGRLGNHPHLVTVHDVGDEGGRPYIVSEYMPGGSVDELLAAAPQRRLSVDHALRLADEICHALEYAHGHGLVHRDLKPANVWLTADGVAKLGDFGLALVAERSRLTIEGMMVGTVAYMPPEQAFGRTADARSDLYAFGAMLYEMLAGRPPFLGDDAVAVISQHINTPPVALSWHNADVPRALEALALRLLAKAPEERPESAAAVRRTLHAIREAGPAVAGGPPAAETNPLDRLASGVFVGREREMDLLRGAFEDALSGRGRLVLLLGEPGIGKTRTAEEVSTYAVLPRRRCCGDDATKGKAHPPTGRGSRRSAPTSTSAICWRSRKSSDRAPCTWRRSSPRCATASPGCPSLRRSTPTRHASASSTA